ncbi:hypothetical protein NE236_05865 [Actinoallomurus purpureus]|uniref:hypothetical protein n=1 Tax=Actinoallomurus purpureus TaxID=478114 RepID=UPI00209289D4|nr:hypothetical protein [Actinoallomurus purpureus]MCO6004502.1 hypothetical protein [Actinoallomurus purpureus]
MRNYARRPIDTVTVAIWAVGVGSVAIAGFVVNTACSIVVNGDPINIDKLVAVCFIGVFVGAVISTVGGVIIRAVLGYRYSFLDYIVAGSSVLVGTVIGGLLGLTVGFCIALGGILASRDE